MLTGLTRPPGGLVRRAPGRRGPSRLPLTRPSALRRGPAPPSAGGDDGLNLAFPTSAIDIREW
jgi:hypothetical protein